MTDAQPISAKKVQRQLFAHSLKSPFVLYPTVSASLTAFAGALFGFNSVLGGLLLGGAALAAGGFLTEFGFRREKNVKSILLAATRAMEHERDQIIQILQQEIELTAVPNARNQLGEFKKKFDTFMDVLDDRFNPGELTFIRYMSVAEQVYLSSLDNLRNAVISNKAIQSTDPHALSARLQQLGDSTNDKIERAALTDRLQGYKDTEQQIVDLMVLNEKALAVLDSVTQKIARAQLSKGMADSDTESAVSELERMGAQLARYVKS